jgi:hypothetical protein
VTTISSAAAGTGRNATSDASPADHDDTSVSRRDTWASSWASTARSSASDSSRSSPSVQHTAAVRELQPTVRMFGCGAGATNNRGTGSRASRQSSRTTRYSAGFSTSLTGRARRAVSTIRSDWK